MGKGHRAPVRTQSRCLSGGVPVPPRLPGGTVHPCPAQGPGRGPWKELGTPSSPRLGNVHRNASNLLISSVSKKSKYTAHGTGRGARPARSSHAHTGQGRWAPGPLTAPGTAAVHLPARLHEGQERVTASRERHAHSTEDTCQRARPHGSLSLSHLKRHILSPEGTFPSDCWGQSGAGSGCRGRGDLEGRGAPSPLLAKGTGQAAVAPDGTGGPGRRDWTPPQDTPPVLGRPPGHLPPEPHRRPGCRAWLGRLHRTSRGFHRAGGTGWPGFGGWGRPLAGA